MLTDGIKAPQKQLYYSHSFLSLEHAWLLGNGKIRQNVTISSLNLSFYPHYEHILFIYTAYDMHFDICI